MNRHDVFLEAMGLGPQWRLKHAPATEDAYAAGGVADADDGMAAEFAAQAAAPAAAQAIEPVAPAAAPQAPAAAAAVPAADPVPVAVQSAAMTEAAPATPATPSIPATRTAPSSGEDTSWFDDAPAAPSTRPALKSPAPAKAPPPARPASNAPASPVAEGGESYAWFDEVPATPIAKPARKPERDVDEEAPWRDDAKPAGRPAQPASPSSAMPDDGMPWFDDAPLPSFDAAFDDLYDAPAEDAGISDAAIARMDRAALCAAVQSCTRCTLSQERKSAVPGRGAEHAPWLVLAAAPNGDDEAQARPLAGAPGQLLDNMLKAINLAPDSDAYVATLVKCRPHNDRAPSAEEMAACRPYLERELALAGSRAILTLGHTAAKGLLGAAARGKVLRLEQIPVVATYHPADLLRKPEDKAKAWADLCLARSAFDGRA